MSRTKYQTFEIEEVSRSQIKMAEYNPRLIDGENKKLLKKGLKNAGLVMPLVWNKRTGNLVSGHQRITILDELERGKDYSLTVSVVDLDEREEKKLNVQLNNKSMQGEFDVGLLGELALSGGFDVADLGFTDFDAAMMFGDDDRFSSLFEDKEEVKVAKDELKNIKENRENMNEKYDKEQKADFFFVVVCQNQAEKDELLKKMSVPVYEKYVSSAHLKRIK